LVNDIRLIWDNAMLFNPPEHEVHKMAKSLSEFTETRVRPLLEAERILSRGNKEKLRTLASTLLEEKENLGKEFEELKTQPAPKEEDFAPPFRPRDQFLGVREMDHEAKNLLCEQVELLDERYSPGLLRLIKEEMTDAQPVHTPLTFFDNSGRRRGCHRIRFR
jgi:hypothetical protein